MKHANTMSTITVELIIEMKTKFTSSNAKKTNGFISPQMSNFHTLYGRHVSTSFLDPVFGAMVKQACCQTQSLWLLNVLLAFVWSC